MMQREPDQLRRLSYGLTPERRRSIYENRKREQLRQELAEERARPLIPASERLRP